MSNAVRIAIGNILKNIPGIGRVHLYERWAKTEPDLRTLYTPEGSAAILGWHVKRQSVREVSLSTDINDEFTTWQILGIASFVDREATELGFNGVIDGIRAAFRVDPTLGGIVSSLSDGQVDGVQVEEIAPVMFAGYLCHQARLTLVTRRQVELGAQATEDFLGALVGWDIEPKGTIDAEDHITLEGAGNE